MSSLIGLIYVPSYIPLIKLFPKTTEFNLPWEFVPTTIELSIAWTLLPIPIPCPCALFPKTIESIELEFVLFPIPIPLLYPPCPILIPSPRVLEFVPNDIPKPELFAPLPIWTEVSPVAQDFVSASQ